MMTVCANVFILLFWQPLENVPSNRKGHRSNIGGDSSSQSPAMQTTNLASLPGNGALLDF